MAVGTAPPRTAAALPCRRRLRERIQSERQVVGGLLKKAEVLVARAKDVHGGAAAAHSEARALPRRGRFLRPETRPAAAAMDGAASPPKKRRKTTAASPIVEVEVIEPTMPKAQRDRLYGLLSSLSAETPLPPHIVGLMQSQCCCVVVPNGDEMDIDLGKTNDAAMFQLLNLLEEFAQQLSKIQPRLAEEQELPKIEASDAISRSSICQMEDGEIADEGADMGIDICGGVSPLTVDKAQFSPLPKQQEDDELIDICGGIDSPVSVNKFPETPRSSSSDSSSSSSSSSCSGSSSSSSDSDSDDDGDSASSRPDTADHPTEAEAKLQPLEQHVVVEQDERAASPDTEMQELIARAQERQKLRLELERKTAREIERKMAREQLQEMKKTARPIYDSVDPNDMKQLGISDEVQYVVSPVNSRDSLRHRGGSLLQKLGFFLKE